MASLDTTAFAAALKTKYPPNRIPAMYFKDHPLLAIMPKDTGFGGDNAVIATQYGQPQGRSHTFATGQTNKTASSYAKFTVTRVSDYAFASITGEAIEAADGPLALMKATESEINSAIRTSTCNLALELWRNGGGARGQLSATAAIGTTVCRLAVPDDARFFEPGMVLQLSADDGTGGGGVRAGTVTLSAVNYETGDLTASGNWTAGIAAAAVSDYIFQEGDYNGGLTGVAGWVTTAASPAALFGVTRTTNRTRLAGIVITASGANIEEKLINAMVRSSRYGARTSHVFLNPLDYGDLLKYLSGKAQYDRVASAHAGISFEAVTIMGPYGKVPVMPDPDCKKSYVYGLQMDTWKLLTLGNAPRIFDLDGNKLLREAAADAYEIRIGYRGNATCNAPGWNWVMAL